MVLRIVIGLVLTAAAAALAGQRLWWLYRVARAGQPAPERIAAVREHPGRDVETQATEVIGQRKLLQWSVPGVAHALTFWGFIVLFLTIIEAYGDLFSRSFAIPVIGHWAVIGFIEDLFAVAVLAGIVTFAIIRLRTGPKRIGRDSRFSGSHTGAAWLVLVMIFLVVATLLLYRGAQINTGFFPYSHGAFASQLVGHWLAPLGTGVNSVLEATFILAQLAVILGFGVFLTYSKHLHIALAPVNVLFSRRPNGLGALQPMRSGGKVLDFEEADPDTDIFGRGKIEDFTWKGMLDMATCTECGRCQSQCPAWATDKPLSPKKLIMDLRDHALAKGPYLLASSDEEREKLPEHVKQEAERPLVGDADAHGVIDPDVLWSCTNCGACVQECPVDIEHIDHISDMRRYQVLIESSFPVEAAGMLKNLENKGDPWGMGSARRAEWMAGLDFEVPIADGPLGDDVEYLFWVGCAGALEDRARKTTRAIATLLHTAGVNFAVLGPGETCTGDPARRMGNEFVFAMLAQTNIATLNEVKPPVVVASCPHCFNALANEYPQFGGDYEVIHHTQLLARLVAEGKLTPVTPVAEKITYHDPCFLGRHNKVFSPPREIMEQVPGVQPQEMHRCKERGFCCGAGGARMWMEERIGKRINTERIDEALGTNPDTVSTACPYCLVMLGDAIAAKKASGEAPESLEIVDVAQLLARSVQPVAGTAPAPDDGQPPASPPPASPPPASPPPASPAAGSAGRLTGAAMPTGRAEAFSDGVFAIAITLLVLSLRLPGQGTLTTSQLLAAWPQYFAYVVSFLTIGIMWMNHHTMLAHVERVDRPLLVLNLLLLMGIVAIPFPTVLVADNLTHHGAATAAVVTYGLVMIAISVGFAGLWIYVATHSAALGSAVPPEALRRSIPGFTGGLVAYVVATLIALFFSALAALIIFGLLAVYYLFEHLPSPAETGPAGAGPGTAGSGA